MCLCTGICTQKRKTKKRENNVLKMPPSFWNPHSSIIRRSFISLIYIFEASSIHCMCLSLSFTHTHTHTHTYTHTYTHTHTHTHTLTNSHTQRDIYAHRHSHTNWGIRLHRYWQEQRKKDVEYQSIDIHTYTDPHSYTETNIFTYLHKHKWK